VSLSTRELDVLRLLVSGMTNREVAGSLGISVRTAEFHRENIRRKLKAQTRSELVAHARSLGLGAA
jgi:DNA-binding CsgD family transcriptional regulator